MQKLEFVCCSHHYVETLRGEDISTFLFKLKEKKNLKTKKFVLPTYLYLISAYYILYNNGFDLQSGLC